MTATVAFLIGAGELVAPLHTTPPTSSGARDILLLSPAFMTLAANSGSSLRAGCAHPSPGAAMAANTPHRSQSCNSQCGVRMVISSSFVRTKRRICAHLTASTFAHVGKPLPILRRHLLRPPDVRVVDLNSNLFDAWQRPQLALGRKRKERPHQAASCGDIECDTDLGAVRLLVDGDATNESHRYQPSGCPGGP